MLWVILNDQFIPGPENCDSSTDYVNSQLFSCFVRNGLYFCSHHKLNHNRFHCGSSWRFVHAATATFYVFRCCCSMNTTIGFHDIHFFYCHCCHNWVQNPFGDDIKIMKIMQFSSQCERALTKKRPLCLLHCI